MKRVQILSGAIISVIAVVGDAWELFRRLLIVSTAAVHLETLVNVIHILGRPKVLQDILHVLTVSAHIRRRPTCKSCLIVDSVATFDAHVPRVSSRDQIKAELTGLDKLHIADSSAHLLLTTHDGM